MGSWPDSSLKTQTCVLIDTCEPLFGYQIIEKVDPQEIGISLGNPMVGGKKKVKDRDPSEVRTCLQGDSQLVRCLTGKTGIETRWEGPHLCGNHFILSPASYLNFLFILGPWRWTQDVTGSLSVF